MADDDSLRTLADRIQARQRDDRKAIDAEVKRVIRDASKKAAVGVLGGLLNDLKK